MEKNRHEATVKSKQRLLALNSNEWWTMKSARIYVPSVGLDKSTANISIFLQIDFFGVFN